MSENSKVVTSPEFSPGGEQPTARVCRCLTGDTVCTPRQNDTMSADRYDVVLFQIIPAYKMKTK